MTSSASLAREAKVAEARRLYAGGWTATAIAEALGVTSRTIHRWCAETPRQSILEQVLSERQTEIAKQVLDEYEQILNAAESIHKQNKLADAFLSQIAKTMLDLQRRENPLEYTRELLTLVTAYERVVSVWRVSHGLVAGRVAVDMSKVLEAMDTATLKKLVDLNTNTLDTNAV